MTQLFKVGTLISQADETPDALLPQDRGRASIAPPQSVTGNVGSGFAVREWRIHLGAHKTASTYIQHVLGDMRRELLAEGIDVLVPHQGLREAALTRLAAQRFKHRFPFIARKTDLTRLVEPLRQGPSRVLLSEEGLLGWTKDVVAGRFYTGLGYGFSVLNRLAAQSDVALYLAIRSQRTFLPSIYAHALRSGPPPEGGFDAVRSWVRRDPPRWSRLVADIRRWAPKARLVIWCYEDFRANEAAILSHLCGFPVMPPTAAPETALTRSGSARAVALAERVDPSLRGPERQVVVNRMFADPAHHGPSFMPFDAEEAAVMNRLYAADLLEIERIAPGALLRFGAQKQGDIG